MMPDGIAFVLTSSNERAGVPSAKKRFPVKGKRLYRTLRIPTSVYQRVVTRLTHVA
jgi:hypothetical protein